MRLCELKVKNFCCIGKQGLTVRIDEIVVLIGSNNVGKSTVLKAYEAFASSGDPLSIDYYHNYDDKTPIEIIGTFGDISDKDIEQIGRKWIFNDDDYGEIIRYKWVWDKPDSKGQKYSWDAGNGRWLKGGMGGWDTKITSCIPTPLKINPFDDYKDMEKKIIEILTEAVKKSVKTDGERLQALIKDLNDLAQSVKKEINESLTETTSRISNNINNVFEEYSVDIKSEAGKIDADKIIASGSHIMINDPNGGAFPLENQGAGLQRTFMWSAIEALAQNGSYKNGRKKIPGETPKMLLIEEPEVFLHPPAIRKARETLFQIAELENWQIMITTHSPVFIDVSKPHTTIIRVEKEYGDSTRTFSTDEAHFDEDERQRLRMIRACHPTINEFFFHNKVYLVEGETELAVLNHIKNLREIYDVHVVNCFGKGNIPMFQKILNHFGVHYTVIHDVDSPKVKRNGKWIVNPMWTLNERIFNAAFHGTENNKIIANFPDFELQYFGRLQKNDKPYHALKKIADPLFMGTDQHNELLNLLNDDFLSQHCRKINNPNDYEDMVNENIDYGRINQPEKWEI